MDITREDVRRELDLEDEARSLGIARYERERPMPWKDPDTTPGLEEEANLPPGKQLSRLAVGPTAEAIRAFVQKANDGAAGRRHSAVKWLELASPEEVAYLAARTAINSAVTRSTFQSTATALGRAIIDHVEMLNFKGNNKGGYNGLVKSQSKRERGSKNRRAAVRKMLEREGALLNINRKEVLHLGTAALEMLIDATGLFTLEMLPRGRDWVYSIRPTEAVQKWLTEQHARSALLKPLILPMVIRPKRWRSPRIGGYLRPIGWKTFVKNPDREYQVGLEGADLSLVYDAVNHIQETPWRINKRLYAVMREAWEGGGILGGLPDRHDRPLPPKPADIETNEEALKAWKREAAQAHGHNAKLLSERLSIQKMLWEAEKFSDEPAIWYPHSLDFRGRIYPMASGIHPQSHDIGKALLEFAHGLPLGPTGGYWLAVHIANLFGVDKVSFKERVEWTYSHAAQLIDSALDPLDGSRFWATADSPWMALAAAMEFAEFLKNGETYVSHMPIPLDGSNSGLQHFSALLRDPIGAAAVNLVPAPEPHDVYSEVAVRAQTMTDLDTTITYTLTKDGEAQTVTIPNPWRGGKVTRKIAKRPTMTFVYSATRFGMQDMILETLRELDEEGEPYLGGADNYQSALYLSHILFEAVSQVVSAASGAMEWLRSVARVASDAGLSLSWTAPDGLPILQAYRETYGDRVSVHWRGRLLKVTLAYNGSALSPRAQANGIAPNFVHSLDAAHLRAVARASKEAGIDHLAVIHDSFATHAANTDRLREILKETFVAQYEPNVLERFREEVIAQLPEPWKQAVPPIPEFGALDLNEVRRSEYLFA